MLSVFPDILFLSPFAMLFMRLAAATVFGYAAWQHIPQASMLARVVAVLEIVCAALLLVGLYTQPAALLGIAMFFLYTFIPSLRTVPTSTNLLLLVLCASLLLSGAGALAFDLPL